MMAPQPRKPSRRIVLPAPQAETILGARVEVTRLVTVRVQETWGTDSATYEVVAHWPLGGYTRQAVEHAQAQAEGRADAAVKRIQEDHQ